MTELATLTKPLLHNPRSYDGADLDPESRRMVLAMIDWFESRGKDKLIDGYVSQEWYSDYLEMIKREKIYARMLTPSSEADGDPHKRWDTTRIAAFSEAVGFYGVESWYSFQCTVIGLGPVWMSKNKVARAKVARLLDEGSLAAFGLSEKEHGADLYSTDMVLTPDGNGAYRANGGKYYIGNGNAARIVTVLGRIEGREGPDQYVWFLADSQHENYKLIKNVINAQRYVSQFDLVDYPITSDDILHTGEAAFNAALNTVNVGKFNLATGALGIAEQGFYEAITHAHNRILYGKPVTDFAHARATFVEAYARLVGGRLFSDRAIDYFRSANADDRRYLLFNPIAKTQVTEDAERAMFLLWDVINAKGFEKDMAFSWGAISIMGFPKLEGTSHVNVNLVLKFMRNYLAGTGNYAPVAVRRDATEDAFLFDQGPARGLGAIQFGDWRAPFEQFADIPNVALFYEQARALVEFEALDADQAKDHDFTLTLGHLFMLIPYGQLILEQAALSDFDRDVIDQIFDALVRDFTKWSVQLHGKPSSTAAQQDWALSQVRKPVVDADRFGRVWEQVKALSGAYEMKP